MTGIQVLLSFFQGCGQTCMYFASLTLPLQRTELTFKVWAWERFECCTDTARATASFPFRCYSCNVDWWHNYDCSGTDCRHWLINGVCTYVYINKYKCAQCIWIFGRNPTCLYKHAGKLIWQDFVWVVHRQVDMHVVCAHTIYVWAFYVCLYWFLRVCECKWEKHLESAVVSAVKYWSWTKHWQKIN